MNERRKQAEAYIYKVMNTLDPTGKNTTRYKNMFAKMSDKEFHTYMTNIKEKKDVLVLYSANMTDKLKMDNLLASARELGIELCQRIRMYDAPTDTYYYTANKYLVLQMPVRRFSQFIDHKLSVAESDKRIDMLTGQVVKPDKAGSISQVEIQALHARGLDTTILELIKYRGGDVVAYAEFKRELEESGRTHVSRETGSIVRSAVVFDSLYSGAHIESNASGG